MIFISDLPSNMPKQRLLDALRKVFSTVGKIKINQQTQVASIDLFRKEDNTSQLNVTATITFEQEESVMKAIEKYNGKRVPIFNDAQIRVKKSEMTTERTSARTPPSVLQEAPLPLSQTSGNKHWQKERLFMVWTANI
ncbi:unnamed protein product [Rotaria sp. Silwood1]|nr:unnamed protein product [Rotaria sp. Silwood1]